MVERKKSAFFFWILLALPLSSFFELAERRRVRSSTRMHFLSSNKDNISQNEKFSESTLTMTTNKLVFRKVHFASSRRNHLLNRTRDSNESEYIESVRKALDKHIRINQLG